MPFKNHGGGRKPVPLIVSVAADAIQYHSHGVLILDFSGRVKGMSYFQSHTPEISA